MVIIPCRPDLPHYDMQVVLDGVTYTLEFRWNTRESVWKMDLKTEDETPILSSVKVVVNFPLCARVASANRLPGKLVAFDTTNLQINPGFEDLGDRVTLLYLTETEYAAMLEEFEVDE